MRTAARPPAKASGGPERAARALVRNVAAASYGALRQDADALAAEAERLGDELAAVLGGFDDLQRDVAALEGEVTDEARPTAARLAMAGVLHELAPGAAAPGG